MVRDKTRHGMVTFSKISDFIHEKLINEILIKTKWTLNTEDVIIDVNPLVL